MSDIDTFDEPYADASDSVGTLRIGKTQYAVAMIWQEADEDTDTAAAARGVAADTTVNGDFFVLRPQSKQFGIGLKERGHAKNMPSLGGHLAEARRGTQGSWVGLFEVEGGYYVVAVRDELILAQTDRFYADEMHARGELENLLNLDAWGEIFAPAEFEVENAIDKDIAQLVSGGKAPRLRDIDKMGSMRKWGLGGAIVVLLLFGGYYYMDYLNELEIEEQARIATIKLRESLPGGEQQAIVVPPMPWEGKPTAASYLDTCAAGMQRAVLDFPGWSPVKMECDASANVRLEIKRTASLEGGGGTVNWIRWTLDRSPSLAKATITPSGADGAVISWAPSEMEKYKADLSPRGPDIGKVRFYLQSWFEEAFTTITFPKAVQNEFVRSVGFSFNTGYEPTKFSTILSKVPGLTVETVKVDLARLPLTYTVEGQVHEQLPLPKNARRAGPAGQARPNPNGPSASAAPATPPRT